MTTIGSLFTGYGGLDMGVAMAVDPDARVAWTSDVEKGPCKLAATRWPGTPNLGDITQINWADVEPVDIICGGSPCQDLSLAGKRAGMATGTRSGLWESMAAAIETIRPRLVVWENVQGALSARAYSPVEQEPGMLGNGATQPALRAAGRVAGDLASLGYSTAWRVVRASDAGAPHQRTRLFIIGYPDGQPWDMRGTATPRQAPGRRPQREPTRPSNSAPALTQAAQLLPTPQATYAPRSSPGYGPNLHEAVGLLPTPKAGDGVMGLPRTSGRPPEKSTHLATRLEYTDYGNYAPAIARWEKVTGRQAPPPTTPPRREGGKPQLSAKFVEWLMGLPDGHVTSPDLGLSRERQLRMLGNGVVPQQAALAVHTLIHTAKDVENAQF